ncbi:MAG TPA: hypothetical protein VFJ16_00530 [Longimicrobium sp.]|nr:hypothetical protein [Longimicrobium sp.]
MRAPRLIPVAALLLAAAAVTAACGESPAKKAAREQARRNSCVAAELALSGKERAARLDTQLVAVQGSPMANVVQASAQFAEAYQAYAEAFSRSADLADSAAFAKSKDDSTNLARQAQQARPPVAPAGTVQGNAANRFATDMQMAANNPDHPCNRKNEDEDS